jgi:hypothetical protein
MHVLEWLMMNTTSALRLLGLFRGFLAAHAVVQAFAGPTARTLCVLLECPLLLLSVADA